MKDWGFDLEEKYHLASPLNGSVKGPGAPDLKLYCGVPAELKVTFEGDWPAAPDGMATFGALRLKDENTDDRRPGDQGGRLVLEVPIRVE